MKNLKEWPTFSFYTIFSDFYLRVLFCRRAGNGTAAARVNMHINWLALFTFRHVASGLVSWQPSQFGVARAAAIAVGTVPT